MTQPTPQATDFDPSATNGIYQELRAAWELNRDFAEMHLHVLRSGEHLDAFGAGGDKAGEPAAQYAWRRNAAIAIDPCADLIHLRVDNLFRAAPVRHYDRSPYRDFIAEFLRNVDGGQTGMDAFMRRSLVMYYVNGVDFAVDKQAAGEGLQPRTLAQERQLGLLPYVHAFGPLERLDWACDQAGGYRWVRYDLGQVPPTDELAPRPSQRQYLTLSGEQWRLYTVAGAGYGHGGGSCGNGGAGGNSRGGAGGNGSGAGGPGGGQRSVSVRSGPVALGVCPVVPFYFKESTRGGYPKVPLSLLTRVAPIARYLLNLVSQIQIDVYRNIAFLVATGVDAEKIPAEITPMGCWALPEGATLQDVAGDVQHIHAKIQFAQTLLEAILRIGKLTGASGELQGRASSGVQVAIERTDLDNEMQMTAAQAEQVEQDLVWLAVSRYQGRLVAREEVGYSVQYNRKFVLTGVSELVDQARGFASMGLHGATGTPALMKILLRKILDAVAKEDDPAFRQALDEIQRATFAASVPV